MMADISETIASIRKAESDAESLIENANKQSTEMIQEARTNADSAVEAAKLEAQEEAKHILLAKEDEAGKEATIITNESETNIKNSLRGSENNVDSAAEVIIETVL
jgi:V/A-type H+-transporting ATPase subunit G/H